MSSQLLILAVVVGLSNWAFRVLPTKMDLSRLKPGGRLASFLEAMGPAAIATLFVSAILPMLGSHWQGNLVAALGLAGVLALFAWRRNVILATLGGSAIYAVAMMVIGLG